MINTNLRSTDKSTTETIAITLPEIMPEDARLIVRALNNGYSRVHLRKPDASGEEISDIIEQIPHIYRERITIHYHLDMAVRYGLGGVHLNRRAPYAPHLFNGKISRSCHSLDEVKEFKQSCDYLFLSPIYDSISKSGYKSNFSKEILYKAMQDGIIDSKVYALGGVTKDIIPELAALGFGGAAMLGSVWKELFTPPVVLTIAGSDCSGGAGIQADIKAISAAGCYASSVITAITAQNTTGVRAIDTVSPDMILSQANAVFEDLDVAAVKTGMIHDISSALAVTEALKRNMPLPVVCDPVMISTSGSILMQRDCISVIEQELFPVSTLITPNLHEAAMLAQREIHTPEQMKNAAAFLSDKYGCATLVKGGHLDGDTMCDILYDGQIHEFKSYKVDSKNLHGTGCTLSAAIASRLALGMELCEAIRSAKQYIQTAICQARQMNIGHGHGPLWHF